jgi:hypothetical protein
MPLSVFISHAVGPAEIPIVNHLVAALNGAGVNAYLAMYDRDPGNPLGSKVQDQIERSDIVLVILTKKGVESAWVNQEVGLAMGKGKRIIPFVEKGLTPEGLLHGVEYFPFDPDKPWEKVGSMATQIALLGTRQQLAQTQVALVEAQNDATRNAEIAAAVVTIGLVLLLIWALSRE